MIKTKNTFSLFLISLIILAAAVSCSDRRDAVVYEDEAPEITKAVAVLQPTTGSDVSGIVYFNKTAAGIEVIADVNGLSTGKHGFHIHQYGDLREADGTSAGGHFNPHGVEHGAPGDSVRHVGDLGNITALNDTTAHYEIVDTVITFSGTNNIIGRAVIIHEGEDDFTTQPTGAAGKRMAMGVIGIANDKYYQGE